MSPARRSIRRRDWPRGLYETRPGYFVWREPGVNGRQHTLGLMPLAQARHEALMANDHIAAQRATLVQRLQGAAHTVADLLAELPAAERANTAKSQRSMDKHIRDRIGTVLCAHLKTMHCAEVIEALVNEGKARMAQAVRSRMVVMCRRGAELGWLDGNPAEQTGTPGVEVKRARLTLGAFRAIHDKAGQVAEWLPTAMMIALVSGQDRATVCAMQRTHLTTLEGERVIVVHRQKTKATNEPFAIPLRLRLDAVGLALSDLLKPTLRSPFFVHHQRQWGNAPVGSAVFPDRVSKAFTAARTLAGIPDEIDGKVAPTFHEIRSLSKRLYDKQGGVDTKALLGHASDKTAAIYGKVRGSEVAVVKVA